MCVSQLVDVLVVVVSVCEGEINRRMKRTVPIIAIGIRFICDCFRLMILRLA